MPIDVLKAGPTKTKEQRLAAQIDTDLANTARAIANACKLTMARIYENPAFKNKEGTFDSDAAYAAFEANTQTGMTKADLQNAARASKAIVNLFAPGTIDDKTPEATIGF